MLAFMPRMFRRLIPIRAISVALLLVGALLPAAPTQAQSASHVTGTVIYRTRNLLPRSARVYVQLVDISRPDTPAALIAEQVLEPQGAAPPYAFTLPYDRAQINASGIYAVQAAIRDGDQQLFVSPRRILVIAGNNPTSQVEVLVEPAPLPPGLPQRILIDSPPDDTLIGSPVTITGRAARAPQRNVLSYRFSNEQGNTIGSGDFLVGAPVDGQTSFVASIHFTLPPQGGPVRVVIFEQAENGAELGLAVRTLFVARPQSIRIVAPTPGAVASSPLAVEGELGRLPSDGRLVYRVTASDGRQVGQGTFPVQGTPGRPTRFRAALPFDASPEGDRIQLLIFDQNQATGEIAGQASVTLGVAPQPQRILIDTPAANAYIGTPVVLTGRTVRYPASGVLGYAVYDGSGAQVGGGVFPVGGSLAVGSTFTASFGFRYPFQGGPIRVDLYDQDQATGVFRATATLNLRTVPTQQQIVIETPPQSTQVGSPVVITGRTARYPRDGVLQYRIQTEAGEVLGNGSFPVQGTIGEPARFNASIMFNPPAFAGPLRAEIYEADQFGNVAASATIGLRWAFTAPAQRRIVIETPVPNTIVGSPVVVTGRATFFPVEGNLNYRVLDSAGRELGSGSVQARPEAGGARFVISAAFLRIPNGGAVFFEVYAVDQATGAVIARDRVQLQQS